MPGFLQACGLSSYESLDCASQAALFQRRYPVRTIGMPFKYQGREPIEQRPEPNEGPDFFFDAWPFNGRSKYEFVKSNASVLQFPPKSDTVTIELDELGRKVLDSTLGLTSNSSIQRDGFVRWINTTPEVVTLERYAKPGERCSLSFADVTLQPAGDPAGNDQLIRYFNTPNACVWYKFEDVVPSYDRSFAKISVLKVDTQTLRPDDYNLDLDDPLPPEQGRQQFVDDLNAFRLRMDPPPDLLYGWFHEGSFGTEVGGAAKPQAGIGLDIDRRWKSIFAHESGHMMGRPHPAAGAPTDTGEVGFNVLDRIALGRIKSHQLSDLMLQGQTDAQRWISIESWNSAFDVLAPDRAPGGFPQIPDAQAYFLIRGIVPADPLIPGSITWLEPGATRVVFPSQSSGSGEIRIRDEHSNLLSKRHFELNGEGDNHADPTTDTRFTVVVPADPLSYAIELAVNGQLADTRTASNNAPTVSIMYPEPGESLLDDGTIEWDSADADGDPLFSAVMYSHDGGHSWLPLTSYAADMSYWQVPFDCLPGTSTGRIRVEVSDGFHRTLAEVGNLVLAVDHAPIVTIASPLDYSSHLAGTNVAFLGQATDFEDGEYDFATGQHREYTMQWRSDRDGIIGNGHALNYAGLSVGTHVITLEVQDVGGQIATASVTVTITSS